MRRIERYDERFLNCRQSQIVAYLHTKGLPVELLFYNTLVSTRDVFRQIFIEHKNKWLFEHPAVNSDDLLLLGVKQRSISTEGFDSAKESMYNLLDDGQSVFMWGDEYYLPYRQGAYLTHHTTHSFMVTGYRKDDQQEELLYVQDWDGLYGYISAKHISDAYNNLTSERQSVTYLDIMPKRAIAPDLFKQRYHQWILHHHDDFELYDMLVEYVDSTERGHEIDHALRVISSSRSCFLKYLIYINASEHTTTMLRECCNYAYSLKNVFQRHLVGGEFKKNQFAEILSKLKQVERELLLHLKVDKMEVEA